jgi:TRAP-type mannitol/chloroaromatic compound transport system substrate-binding protein
VFIKFECCFSDVENFNDLPEDVKDMVIDAFSADYGEEQKVNKEFDKAVRYLTKGSSSMIILRSLLSSMIQNYITIAERKYKEEQEKEEDEEKREDEDDSD